MRTVRYLRLYRESDRSNEEVELKAGNFASRRPTLPLNSSHFLGERQVGLANSPVGKVAEVLMIDPGIGPLGKGDQSDARGPRREDILMSYYTTRFDGLTPHNSSLTVRATPRRA